MDKIEALEIFEEAARIKARSSLISFIEFTNQDYDTQWFHRIIAQKCEDILHGKSKKIMIFVPPQHGKFLPADTPIFTPKGWICHSDLKSGDYVFGDDGKPKMVIGNSGIYEWNVEKIIFQGNIELLAAKEHEWKLYCDHDNHKGRVEKIYETQKIFEKRHRRNPAINISPALHLPDKTLPIDPYILGIWLGDGHRREGVLTCGSEDIEHFKFLGKINEVKPGIYRILIPDLYKKLRINNLLYNKQIYL